MLVSPVEMLSFSLSLSLSSSCLDGHAQHDTDILAKLVLDDGSVLRASTNALPTLDCLMRCPQAQGGGLLQIWALNAVPGAIVRYLPREAKLVGSK